jgi:formamidopyrimidine-DNA glycosylase
MPELPEVETVRRQLEPRVVGRSFRAVETFDHPRFTPAHDAVGQRVTALIRRGKYLLFQCAPGYTPATSAPSHELIVHLGMTGSLRAVDAARGTKPAADPYRRALWKLDDGGLLVFRDVRRFGRIHFTDLGEHGSIPTLANMGPEPLGDDFNGAALWSATRGHRRAIKTQLLSQRPVAGVGNIYADEALWAAGIPPTVRRLGRQRADRLAAELRRILGDAVDHGGTTFRDYVDANGSRGGHTEHLQVYGRAGQECRRCGAVLVASVVDGRTTVHCKVCQSR